MRVRRSESRSESRSRSRVATAVPVDAIVTVVGVGMAFHHRRREPRRRRRRRDPGDLLRRRPLLRHGGDVHLPRGARTRAARLEAIELPSHDDPLERLAHLGGEAGHQREALPVHPRRAAVGDEQRHGARAHDQGDERRLDVARPHQVREQRALEAVARHLRHDRRLSLAHVRHDARQVESGMHPIPKHASRGPPRCRRRRAPRRCRRAGGSTPSTRRTAARSRRTDRAAWSRSVGVPFRPPASRPRG